jgi:pimeloyl-ACP methyl ester carboxylesterase
VSFNLSGSGVDDSGNFVFPERFGHNTFARELADIGTVVDALGRGELGVVPPTGIALVGHSRGGGMAVLYAARDPRIRALVTWAAIAHVDRFRGREAEWRAEGRIVIENARTRQLLPLYIDVLDEVQRMGGSSLDISASAGQLTIPWLIVHGEADTSVAVEEAELLAAASRRPTTRLLRIPDAGHTFGAVHPFAGMTPDLERVMLETVSFLARSLAGAARGSP